MWSATLLRCQKLTKHTTVHVSVPFHHHRLCVASECGHLTKRHVVDSKGFTKWRDNRFDLDGRQQSIAELRGKCERANI